MSVLRLLHVVPTYVPAWRHGGPVRAVHGLCRALAARGHEIAVLTTDVNGDGTLDVPRGQPVLVEGVSVWYFPVRSPRRMYRSPALGSALRREVPRFDLVHAHSLFLAPVTAAARVARRAGVPYVLAPRGMLVADLFRRRGRWRKLAWLELSGRRLLAGAAALHCTAEVEAAEAARFTLPLPPAAVVPNGVDLEPFGPAEEAAVSPAVRALLAGPPFVLFLGRVSWKKGLDRLVPAMARVPGARLAVAGNDEEGYTPALRRLAAEAGVAERVVFLGPVQGADRAALLHRAAVLALPSYSENWGNAALEGLAAGCPAVVTPEVGIAGLIAEERCGVVAPGEAGALGKAIRDLLAVPALRAEMGRRGAEVARRRFSWDAVAGQMEEVYRAVLSGDLARDRSRRGSTGVPAPPPTGSPTYSAAPVPSEAAGRDLGGGKAAR